MLADIALHWEQRFMEKSFSMGKQEGFSMGRSEGISIGEARGISIGRSEGVRSVLHDLLQNRFNTLPQDMHASIASVTDTNTLRMLTQEVYRVESLETFRTLLEQTDVSKN